MQDLIETVAPQAIYLEGTLPHESQILVSDSEERLEEEPSEEDGEGPAIVLSSKMTLSLISLDKEDRTSSKGKQNGTRDQARGKDPTPRMCSLRHSFVTNRLIAGSATDLVETIGASDTLNKGM